MNVIFDMDGLMFDTERVFLQAWDYAGEQMGIGRAGYMIYKTLGMNASVAAPIWAAEFGERYRPEELRRHTKAFLEQYYAEHPVPVKPGLYALLDYLWDRGCKMAVASSSPRWEVENHLQSAGVSRYFVGIVCGDMVEHSKPAPDIYQRACALLKAPPKDCLALEDSKSGLLAARRAGCRPVMVPDLWQPDGEALPIIAAKYDSLEQVKRALETGELCL